VSITLVQVIVSGLLLGAVYALFSSGLTLTLGVLSYFLLVRHIMRGPMLAQILGTFGLALFLRYAAFWTFGADFKTLPDTMVGGSFILLGIRFEGSRVLAGGVGLGITLFLHLLLTRTAVGSRMLAVSEDATAAELMGIRPQRMQALAWALAGAATGIAGALIANFFYTSPTVGETLAILAFVVVSFGGFGSVLGALVAGLIIGVVESLSAYLVGPVYKDVIVYVLFVLVLWFRPQGLMGKA
jgi:branched-chain amino acid transport system permease protein